VPERDLRRKLFWLIAIRVGISTLLLGSAVVVQLTSPGSFPVEPLFLLIGVTYALNIIWTATLRWAERYLWLVDVQLACDAFIVSGFIAVTGGIASYFAALYVLPIAAASSLHFRRVEKRDGFTSRSIHLLQARHVAARGFVCEQVMLAVFEPANCRRRAVEVNAFRGIEDVVDGEEFVLCV